MAIYESVIILDSLLASKEIDGLVEEFSGIITSNSGTIRKVDKWGKKRLAFEINKKQYGFYLAIEFDGSGNIPNELESNFNYNDNVLRYLTYKYDKHQLQAMEEAAKLEQPVAASAPAPAAKAAPEEPKKEADAAPAPEPEVETETKVEETKESEE
jgi:small subunit ribosomal protein S6